MKKIRTTAIWLFKILGILLGGAMQFAWAPCAFVLLAIVDTLAHEHPILSKKFPERVSLHIEPLFGLHLYLPILYVGVITCVAITGFVLAVMAKESLKVRTREATLDFTCSIREIKQEEKEELVEMLTLMKRDNASLLEILNKAELSKIVPVVEVFCRCGVLYDTIQRASIEQILTLSNRALKSVSIDLINGDVEVCVQVWTEHLCNRCLDLQGRQTVPGVYAYEYKPDAVFYGEAPRFLGVELEIDHGIEKKAAVSLTHTMLGEHVYCKKDGSLDNGFEIVTHPHTLEEHKNLCYKELFEGLKDMKFESQDAGTCGLHIHVSKKALGETELEQDNNILKVLFLQEMFWKQIKVFSRRNNAQIFKWAKRYGCTSLEKAKKSNSKNRYYALNLSPENTIEFRIFRGSLSYSTFMATIQFVDYMVEYAVSHKVADIQSLTWETFIEKIPHKELIQYLAERSL
jgi:hypothetical protein